MSDLRPMALGEIIDRSAQFWRANWRAMYGLFLGFQLVEYILIKGWQLAMTTWFPDSQGQRVLDLVKSDPLAALTQLGISTGSLMVVILVSTLSRQFLFVAGTRFVFPRVVSRGAPSSGEALRFALGKVGVTTASFLISVLWAAGLGVLLLLPGLGLFAAGLFLGRDRPAVIIAFTVLGGLAMVAAMLVLFVWYILRFVTLAQVVALEDASVGRVLARTAELSSGRVGPGFTGLVKFRLTVLLTVVGVLIAITSVVASAPELILNVFFGGFKDGVLIEPPQRLLVPAELISAVVSTIVWPLYVVFQVMFYVDMRVRREGLDLELQLQEKPA